jgi:hypothetical protein
MDLVLIFGSVIVMVTVLGGMMLSGWRYWVRNKSSLPADEVTPALQDAIRNEVDRALRARDGELAELHERIDFAERLLSRPGPGGGVGDREEPK